MKFISFETPKAGIEDFRNEDSVCIRRVGENSVMAAVSDGASTGVFSKEWSDHITHSFDADWLKSVEDFENGLNVIRESFKPTITRPTALRKFLMEGSYATLLTALITKQETELGLTLFSVGDVCIFTVTREWKTEFVFPYKSLEEFNNIPYLIRSATRLQEKSPYEICYESRTTSADNLIVIATDALSEYLFKVMPLGKIPETLKDIIKCKNNSEFKELTDFFRDKCGMKNDDVSVCFITERPDLYL
ncbi:MAG: protein phosphatase 2C domain-containing protein [Desulfobacterales bacterium]|nr:protein phosphatase 2C domain-containing protein [Desulfobacterales bacterium]